MTALLNDFLEYASVSQSVLESTYAARRLRDLLPALTEYTRLVQFYLTHHIAGLRASAKLLSVLLSVFASLAQKVSGVVLFDINLFTVQSFSCSHLIVDLI